MLGSSQFGKLRRCGTIRGEDRISELPDAIISHILNYLTLKEAIATGILSRRWKNLWTWRSNLDFECVPLTSRNAYIQIVDQILKQHKAPTLHKLRIVCPLLDSHGHHVDDWISFALRKGVSELSFDYFCLTGRPQNYHVRAHVFVGDVSTLPNGRRHFETLTQLCLRCVNISDEVFDLILSNCFSLERFLLMCTYGLVNAKCTTSNLKLKSLELYHCKQLECLQLSAPNLLSFKYKGWRRTLCIKDAKHLASLSLSIYYALGPDISSNFPRGKSFIFSQFSSHLPKLESLVVTANNFEDMVDFTELNALSNLKQLTLDVGLTSCVQQSYRVAASIIRAAPYLELFEMNLPTLSHRLLNRRKALKLASMPPHQNLKEFKLFGFRGDDNTMNFLTYIVEYAVSLQKIDITARGALLSGEKQTMEYCLDWNGDDPDHTKNCVLQLRQTLHSNVQLVFHDG